MVKSLRADGGLNVDCPRRDQHTGDSSETSTVYFPQHTGGYARSAFKCQHAHCAGVPSVEFAKALGFEGDPSVDALFSPVETAAVAGTVQLICGTDVEPEPIDWLWRGYLARGMVHIAAGRPGCGKSTIALALAATVTTGGKWSDGTQATVGNVLMWSGEDSVAHTLMPRIVAMGGNRSRIYFVGAVDADNGNERSFDPARDMAGLQAEAEKIGNVSLVIVDPVVLAVAGDSHKNAETRRGLQPVADLAEKLNTVVIGISHFTKGTAGSDPVERVTGSLAFGAVARIVFGVAKMQDSDDRIFVRAKSNVGPDGGGFKYRIEQVHVPGFPNIVDGASRIVWDEVLDGSAQALLKEAESDVEPSKEQQARNLVAQLLEEKSGKLSAENLYESSKSADIGRDATRKTIKSLKLVQTRPTGPRGPMRGV